MRAQNLATVKRSNNFKPLIKYYQQLFFETRQVQIDHNAMMPKPSFMATLSQTLERLVNIGSSQFGLTAILAKLLYSGQATSLLNRYFHNANELEFCQCKLPN